MSLQNLPLVWFCSSRLVVNVEKSSVGKTLEQGIDSPCVRHGETSSLQSSPLCPLFPPLTPHHPTLPSVLSCFPPFLFWCVLRFPSSLISCSLLWNVFVNFYLMSTLSSRLALCDGLVDWHPSPIAFQMIHIWNLVLWETKTILCIFFCFQMQKKFLFLNFFCWLVSLLRFHGLSNCVLKQ